MTERELRDLRVYVDLPPERDIAPAVRARIGTRRPRPGKLVVVPALVVLAVALALAVPPARSEIFRWLGLGNARIEFVDRLPHVEPQRPLDLGEADREAIACRYFLDLSEEETAAALGCRRGTVKSRLARALESLRAELGDEV